NLNGVTYKSELDALLGYVQQMKLDGVSLAIAGGGSAIFIPVDPLKHIIEEMLEKRDSNGS
ncbi:hypothetical protein LCGC14_3083220, partial [marine sediment metagenome]